MPWCDPPEPLPFKPDEPIKGLPWLIKRSEKVTSLSGRRSHLLPFRVKVGEGLVDSIGVRARYRSRAGFILANGEEVISTNAEGVI